MIQTPLISILCFALAALLGAAGQFLYKSAADAGSGLAGGLLSLRGIGGIACYVAVMVLFMQGFRRGGAVSVLYPIYATTFIWAAIWAAVNGGAAITPVHIAGMGLLLSGIYLMAL